MSTASDHAYVLRSDFNEITKTRIINQLKEKLQNHNFNIQTKHNQIRSDAIFIKNLVTRINELGLNVYDVDDSNETQILFNSLCSPIIKVYFVV